MLGIIRATFVKMHMDQISCMQFTHWFEPFAFCLKVLTGKFNSCASLNLGIATTQTPMDKEPSMSNVKPADIISII